MQKLGAAISILPVRDMAEAVAFWSAVPRVTVEEYAGGGYAFVRYEGADLVHLGLYPEVDPATNRAGCIAFTSGIDALREDLAAAGLPVSAVRVEPWGLREFRVYDSSGNSLRVGSSDEYARR